MQNQQISLSRIVSVGHCEAVAEALQHMKYL